MRITRIRFLITICIFLSIHLPALCQPVINYLGIEQGLSNNSVRSVHQDHNGFMWFATYDGLNRYDGYHFKVFRNKFNNANSLVNNIVSAITEDQQGYIWAGTRQGLSIYNLAQDTFQRLMVQQPSGKAVFLNDVIKDIKPDAHNNMFVASENNGLFIGNAGHNVAKRISIYGQPAGFSYGVQAILTGKGMQTYAFVQGRGLYRYNYELQMLQPINETLTHAICMIDAGTEIWLGSGATVFRISKHTNALTKLATIDTTHTTTGNQVFSLSLESNGKLWVGTSTAGVEIWDTATTVKNFLKPGDSRQSLSGSMIYNIYQDRQGRKWICTARGGVNVVDPARQKVKTIAHDPATSAGLPGNFVSFVFQFNDSLLWIATEGSGLTVWNHKTNSRSSLQNVASLKILATAYIVDIKRDYKGDIWLVTFNDGIYRYHPQTGALEHYKMLNTVTGYENKVAFHIYEDHQKNLWASTLRTGDIKGALFLLNRTANKFEVFDHRLSDIFCMTEDADNQLWAGNLTQLIKIDKQQKKHQYFSIGNSVRAFYTDAAKQLWIGTEGGGLLLFNPETNRIINRFTTEDGLCNNSIAAIVEGDKQTLWLSTYNGISRFNIPLKKFTGFYKSDGLQSSQFNQNAACRLSTGELAFGGIKGLNLFYPDDILPDSNVSKLFFNAIQVNGAEVNSRNPFVVKTADGQVSEIKVPYSEAVFRFDFSSPDFSTPDKIGYAYFMEGWDKGWSSPNRSRSATYTHLSEGTYTFRVKCSTEGQGTGSREISMLIRVLPPWYRSWWAYLFYTAVVFAAIYGYYRYNAKQARLLYKVALADMAAAKERAEREKENAEHAREKTEREKEKILNEKEKEIAEKRVSFFTNISHEFRTPLSLIINPIKDMLKKESNGNAASLHIMHRNAKRLLSLVDQLLLFRKTDSGLDRLSVSETDIGELIREVFLCFTEGAKSKNIVYNFTCTDSKMPLFADGEKMEIIFYNLISNAIKYTPDGGTVSVAVTQDDSEVAISITDSGPGIPDAVGDNLYEKFYQVQMPKFKSKPGFGIGLYMVKQFVQAHKGSISYKNNEDGGVTFTIGLLKGKSHFLPEEIVRNEVYETRLVQALMEGEEAVEAKQPQPSGIPVLQNEALLPNDKKTMLIVDDEEQMRNYIAGIFSDTFVVYQGSDGAEGLKLVKKYEPDLIISDIKMSEMDGVSFCRLVKENPSFSHIPFILLTGTSSQELKLEGIEVGADDYIMKPFDSEILLARVNTLLRNRSNLQKYFYNEITLNKNDQLISAEYRDFLNDCIKIVEKHLDEEDFGVKTFTKEIGMSYSNLLRKVKYVSGLSINEFIRFIRLRKAAELLINTDYNVNETAFNVGISDIKYFRKQFHKLFGLNPSDFIRQYRKTLGKHFKVNKDAFSSHTGEE